MGKGRIPAETSRKDLGLAHCLCNGGGKRCHCSEWICRSSFPYRALQGKHDWEFMGSILWRLLTPTFLLGCACHKRRTSSTDQCRSNYIYTMKKQSNSQLRPRAGACKMRWRKWASKCGLWEVGGVVDSWTALVMGKRGEL